MEVKNSILEKWKDLIYAAKAYWIDSIPTGMDDATFDSLEKQAIQEDGFSVRDYVFQTFLVGERVENKYIEKIKKTKVEGKTMLQALKDKQEELGEKIYVDLKYDGSSIAIYLNSETGEVQDIVTVGNANIDSFGIRQYGKLMNLVPKKFPSGIVAIQCEALIDLDNLPPGLDPEKARQKSNGLINSRYAQEEVDQFLTLRAYRYYLDPLSPDGIALSGIPYNEVLASFPVVSNQYGIKFAPADVFEVNNLPEGFPETYRTRTSTGEFLNDGWVCYNLSGQCLGALKFAGAGSESDGIIKTKVKSIKWTDQTPKGKDSWAANVIIEPVVIHGSTVTKPSAGSVKKLVQNKISPGAEVSVILANSTIPMIGECFKPGNEDYMFPKCSCGYQMSDADIYGSRLKCGNTRCSSREARMREYLKSLDFLDKLNLNVFLVIDGFKWENTDVSITKIIKLVEDCISWTEEVDPGFYLQYREYLMSYMNTDARKRNLDLVVMSSWLVLCQEAWARKTNG